MSLPSTCPDSARLARLLAGSLPERERRELTGHLDGCAECQSSLERLAIGDTDLAVAVPAVANEPLPPTQSRYWHAVQELERDAATVIGRSGRIASRITGVLLEFLEPTETPGHLGRL